MACVWCGAVTDLPFCSAGCLAAARKRKAANRVRLLTDRRLDDTERCRLAGENGRISAGLLAYRPRGG